MEYIPFTPEQVEQANQIDLEEFLLQHGEKLLRSGPEKRMASNHSVTIRGNEWFDHADRKGGKAVSFVERYLDVPFQEAMQILLGEQGVVYAPAQPKKEEPPKPFVLPPAHTDNRWVMAYLERTRKISGEVLRGFEKEGLIYEDSQYHNAVFVGFDEAGVARHAHKRSTNTQGRQFKINVEGCNARYSFHWTGSSDKIYVFEAPIDMLSFISMKPDWQQHSYVGLCGLSEHALIQQLEEHPQLSDIVLCMDNDEAGIAARNRIKHILQERGYTKVSSLLPSSKDWNEDLQRGIVMTEKVREYLTLSRETTVAITQDQERWKAFLCTAGQMYKYSFNNQVLIFAQRPEATACASYDVWNKTMRRYVKRGAKGIALLDTQDKHLKLHYVFDVLDTSDGNRAREVHVWQMKEEQTPSVQKVLENTFGVPATIGSIQEQVTGVASVLWMNRWTQHKDNILDNIDDSFKKEYDEFTIQEMFRKAVVPSVVGAVCSRCGVQMPGMTAEDFENISKFQTPKMVNILGNIVTGFSNETLRVVERTVKQLEKDERSKQHGYSVQTSGRGSDPRPGADGYRYDAHSAVGADAQRVFAGAQTVHVQRHGDGADPVSPPSGDRPGSSGANGHSDAAAGQGGGSHGGAEEEGPDEVGGPDEHLQGPSGGDYPGGTDLQLSLFPTEAEQIQRIEEAERVADTFSAFSFAQADIDHVLRLGGNTYRQRECIVVAFEEQKSTAEIADTLKNLYHGGNGIGSVTAWYAEDGIHLSHGKTARYDKSAQVISWESAAERIGQLLQDGQFASSVELSEAEGYERSRLAEKLWHLYHDFSEEAKEAEYLPSLADNPGRGFPEESAWLTEQLKSPEFRQILAEEYAAFWKAYRQDRKLMRFHYHKPREIWEGLKDLSLPHTKFSSQMTEVPSVKQFISEDEIDAAMARGSGFEGGKGRIFTFFKENHTDKEKVDFLRHEYGIGGYTHALSGATRSEESHDGKGLHYKKDACPEVHFTWEKVAKRITNLIQTGRYLTEQELAEYDKIQTEKDLAEEATLQIHQPDPAVWEYNGVKERHPDDMVLYQMGDYYELYGEDAKKAALELGLSLISRTIPGGGHVAMCGFPANRLEQVVERLRDKHDVTISAVPEGGKERQEYTMISIDHEAEQHINAHEAEFGADGTRVFQDNETGADPTIRELYEQYKPMVIASVMADEAYRNACVNSDQENAYLEGRAAVKRAVQTSGDMQLYRLYFDVSTFHTRLEREVLEDTYSKIRDEMHQAPSSEQILLEQAKELIEQFCRTNYGTDADFTYLDEVCIVDTVVTDEEIPIRVNVDLLSFSVERYLDEQFLERREYSSLELLIGNELLDLSFADLVHVSEEDLVSVRPGMDFSLSDLESEVDAWEAEQAQEKQAVVDTLSEREKTIVRAMETAGFIFTPRAAHPGLSENLVFTAGEYGYPVTFQNWEQVYEWIDGAQLLDTPGLREQVQEILHADINLTGGESQLEEALPIPFVEGYTALKAQYYDAVVGVEVGRYVVFLGDDAHIASKAMGTKVLSVDIPGMGVTDMTGNHLGWPAVLKRLMEQNLNIVLAQQDPEGGPEAPYEIIKERYAGEYDLRTDEEYAQEELVPGETIIEMDGRTFQVSKLELDIGRVELRDITFAQAVGFPIFRVEPISVVRDYLEQEPLQVSEKTLEEILDEHPISVEINGQWHTFPNAAAAEEYENNLRGNAQNYHITDENLGTGGPKEKFWRNIKAIATLKQIEKENRNATLEEQHLLSQYVGWGGLADAFNSDKSAWATEYSELKDLLTPEEYAAARGSILNAHYTSPVVIRAIYEAVGRMGFESGNILEPSCGVGNFFGMLPESMAGSKLYGVELDSISGRIAQKLYPKADITVAGFETTDRRGFYDLAIGNVPFGQYQVNDKAYNKLKFNIHNYFFAKALDQVRPGGVVAFVTSRYTMDSKDSTVRRYLAQRAELLGAIRLPNNAFKANAGAEVVSDIIFLQKRDRPLEIAPEWTQVGQNQEGHTINQYFVDHPYMVLGREELQSSAHGMAYTVSPLEGADLAQQLHEAVGFIDGVYEAVELPELAKGTDIGGSIPADPTVKNFSYTLVDGVLYYRENSIMVRPDLTVTGENRARELIGLRQCVQQLIEMQMDATIPDGDILDKQAELNRLYDKFSAKYGLINDRANRLAFANDSSYYLLCALEEVDDDGRLIRKADMFTKRTIKPHQAVLAVDTASEALAVSIAEKACVDMVYMEQLTGKTEKELAKELNGVVFRLPGQTAQNQRAHYETADAYLSGNVRVKLREAQRAAETNPVFRVNVEALEKAQPKDLDASEIEVRLGATWIDKEYIQQFMYEIFDTPSYLQHSIKVNYSSFTAEWQITNKSYISGNDIAAYTTYGTDRASAYKILEESLNLRDIRIYDRVEEADGRERRVLNPRETTLAQQKQQAIRDAFRDWIWRDPERRQTLVHQYNEEMNSTRPREYDGSHITFGGMNPEITLREHQKNAIAHVLYGGNTLLAHEVGAGKTFEMVAAAMESKRLGLCQKSLFVVPNHLTGQWASEFLRLYPAANILVTTKKDFEPGNRKRFCARIATGDYDAVILGHSQFEKIPISQERQERLLQEQIDEITEGIAQVKESGGEQFTIKQLEHTRKSLESRLEKLRADERKDDVVTFEQLGVDRLFVDEAHLFKNCAKRCA